MAYPRSKKDKHEHFPTSIHVGDKNCNGCDRWQMDIMISHSENSKEIHDVFLTKKQAIKLALELLDKAGGEKELRNYKLKGILG